MMSLFAPHDYPAHSPTSLTPNDSATYRAAPQSSSSPICSSLPTAPFHVTINSSSSPSPSSFSSSYSLSFILSSIAQATLYLNKNARHLYSCLANSTLQFRDNFSQLLILDHIPNPKLVYLSFPRFPHQSWNYFIDDPSLLKVVAPFPDDVDTTSVANLVFCPPLNQLIPTLKYLLSNISPHCKIMRVYFDDSRERFDPVVCCNVLRLFHRYRYQLHLLQPTEDYVYETLVSRSYLDGTRHYHSPSSFLYFCTRLYAESTCLKLRQRFSSELCKAVLEILPHTDCDPLALAMNILMAFQFNLDAHVHRLGLVPLLLSFIEPDAGWRTGWVCRLGKSKIMVGSRGVTTVYAIRALSLSLSRSSPSPSYTSSFASPFPTLCPLVN